MTSIGQRNEYDNYNYPKQEERMEVTEQNRAEYLKVLEDLQEFVRKTAKEARKASLKKRT